jgi:hypothetical protein
MLDASRDELNKNPCMYRADMLPFLRDKAISQSTRRPNKATRRVTNQRNSRLHHHYKLSKFKSYHSVFIEESGCHFSMAQRRKGWAPIGTTPVHVADFKREVRHPFISAYTQDGVMLRRVFQGSTDHAIFVDFIGQLLRHCGKSPQATSVLVMTTQLSTENGN